MADPQRRASSSSRYYSPRKLSEWQQIDDHYNRLNAVADDNLARNESMLNDECHAHQLGFLRRTDIPADVGEKLRELLVENRDLRIDSLRRDYNAMKKDRLEDKKKEEREMFAKMGPGNSEPKVVAAGTPFASPSISEGSPVHSPRNEERHSPAYASTPMPSSIPEPDTPKHATQPPLGYRSSPLNPASGTVASASLVQSRTPLSQQPNTLPRPGAARNTGAAVGSTVTPLQSLQSTPLPPQPTTKDHLQAQQASQRAAQALAQVQHAANSGKKPTRDTPPSAPPPASSKRQQQAFPSPKVVPSQGPTPILSSLTKKRKPEAVDDHMSSGPEVGSDRNKRPKKSDGARTTPSVNIPLNRVITFEDVHQGGDPTYMHTIVKWEDDNFYILYCEEHGVHFRQKALTAAAKHLDSIAHGNMGRFHHMALEKLGYRISDCDDHKRARHNAIVTKAFDNGYFLPSSESLLNPGKTRPAEKRTSTPKSTDTVNSKAAEHVSLDAKQSQSTQQPGYDAVHKGLHHTKLGKRKSLSHKNLAIITNPVAGELYHATPKPKFGDRPKKYIVMILAWKDLAICGLPGRTLGQLELIQQAKRKTCYYYDAEGISGWMPEYQDDGKLVKKRWFPVIWFEGTKTEDKREGWVRAEELSNFDLYPVPKRGQYHPEIRAREWYWRSHPGKAPDSASTSKARSSEKTSEMQQSADGTSTANGQVEDPDATDVDDTESDSKPADEGAPAWRGPLSVVDHASDSDYHASDDGGMAESVTSSQASPPPLPPQPPTRKSNLEVRSKAVEAESVRPVTPVRAGAAAGTRSSTKKQAVERDVDMEDAPSLVHDELSPLSRRAKDSGPGNEAVLGQAVAVTPQTVQANPSVQLGTPLDKKLPKTDVMAAAQQEMEQQEGSERSAKQQTLKTPEAVGRPSQAAQEHDQQDNAQDQETATTQDSKETGTQGVVDQARNRAVDQASHSIVTETIQGLVDEVADKGRMEDGEKPHHESSHGKPAKTQQATGHKVALPAAGHNSDDQSAPMSMSPTPGAQQANALSSSAEATGMDVDPEKTKQQPREPVERTVSANSSVVDGRNGGVETPVEATPSTDKPPNDTSTNGSMNSASPNGNTDIDQNAAHTVESAQAVATNTGPRMADPKDRWRAIRTSNSPVMTPPILNKTTNRGEGSVTNTASTPPASAPASTPAPTPVKNPEPMPAGSGTGSGSGPISEPGSRLSTPVVQTPPVQSPRLPSLAVKRGSEVGGVVWQVSALQQGNRRWSDATHTLRLVVDEAGVARTSDSDEMDAAVDPQAIQTVHYSQSTDKSRTEVILTPMKGSVEQKLTFTVGAGRNKMQSFKFVRWLRQANPDITLVDGPVLG